MLRRILAFSAFACLLNAQEYRSTLTGRITDPSGSAVPNVNVTATKTDTNTHFPTTSGPEGFYTLPLLPPGTYELAAESPGFKKYVQSGIAVASTVRVSVDVQLTTGSASAGQSITTREVEGLPINGRAPMDLAAMAYGVVNTGNRDQNRPY